MNNGFDILRKRAELAKRKLRGMPKPQKNFNNYIYGNFEIKKIAEYEEKDIAMYKKLKDLLDSNQEIINPIYYLMDNTYYQSLDSSKKELYFFKTVASYKKCKQLYENEKRQATDSSKTLAG